MNSGSTRESLHLAVLALGCMLVFAGCASHGIYEKEPWMENGTRVGTIEIRESEGIYEYQYVDSKKRLMRFEMRDAMRNRIPGIPAGFNVYDHQDRLSETYYQDSSGAPAINQQGFSRARYDYGTMDMRPYHEVTYFGLQDQRVVRSDGAALERVVYVTPADDPDPEDGETEVWRIEWRDLNDRPVEIGAKRVAAIQYSYLSDLGEMIFATHFSSSGSVKYKEKVSGEVTRYTSSYSTTYY